MPQCVVIADDLTGGNATGVQLRQSNFTSMSILTEDALETAAHADSDCVIYPTNSRAVPPEEAYRRVYNATRKLMSPDVKVYSKRVDSTLRGNLGAETDAMLAAAEKALTRERAIEQQLHVSGPRAARLDAGERQGLAERYAGLTFTETYITPGGGRLPPAFAERAKALHHRLDKLLRQQRERSASQRTGALSQRELWKIPLDAKDVFRRKAPPSRRETAFYLLIDRSGSMGAGVGGGQSKLFTALATAAVLEEALKGIAYTKIVAFDGGTNAVEHCVIKDFDQKEIGSRCIDAMEQIAAGNGNKDGYSIRAAALDLAKRTERRKILMVLSDGLPSGYFSEAEAIDDVRTAVQAVRRRGLLVIPIIYTARTDENVDAYRRMYEKSMIFADSVGMLGEFERLLMKLVR